jgi:hippurate hydrolase
MTAKIFLYTLLFPFLTFVLFSLQSNHEVKKLRKSNEFVEKTAESPFQKSNLTAKSTEINPLADASGKSACEIGLMRRELAPLGVNEKTTDSLIDKFYPEWEKFYKYLHANPELSFYEKKTMTFLSDFMKKNGFEVSENFGGYGLVCVLKNGKGKTVLLRTDTDALPIAEKTGAEYASKITTKDDEGNTVGVMHACGHDMHMSVWAAVAQMMAASKNQWSGTLICIAQPAEERGGGAKAMLKEGLFEKFPLPDYALALHCTGSLPAGTVGFKAGAALAFVDMVDYTIFGEGGHGAYPHLTKDPIVLAAKIISDFQTIVSREVSPQEPAVLTVGSIHGGTKHNIIPNEVKLQITLRCYSAEVREQMLKAMQRIAEGNALAHGLPKEKMPLMHIRSESLPALENDDALTAKLKVSVAEKIGKENVFDVPAVMGAEDFGLFGKTQHKVPICLFWLGILNAEKYKKLTAENAPFPSLHTDTFLPHIEPSLKTGTKSMLASLYSLMK